MLFVIYALDAPGSKTTRKSLYDTHRSYLDNHGLPIDITLAGPLMLDETPDAQPIGSLIIVSADRFADVERFHHNDPFFREKVWGESSIVPFVRRR